MKKLNNKEIRLEQIVHLVNERQKISSKELSELMNVSDMTIRRDLDLLQQSGSINRIHGFAVAVKNIQISNKKDSNKDVLYDFRLSSTQNMKEKEKIAKYAASLIDPEDWIFIDNGTTTTRLANYFPNNINFTALCNSATLMSGILRYPNINLVMPGGYYDRVDQSFSSVQADSFIRTLRANKAFLSASGIHKTLGITCINSSSILNKRAFIDSAAEKILLVDSSKFGVVTANHIGELSEIDMIITDSGLSQDWINYLEHYGIDLHIV